MQIPQTHFNTCIASVCLLGSNRKLVNPKPTRQNVSQSEKQKLFSQRHKKRTRDIHLKSLHVPAGCCSPLVLITMKWIHEPLEIKKSIYNLTFVFFSHTDIDLNSLEQKEKLSCSLNCFIVVHECMSNLTCMHNLSSKNISYQQIITMKTHL